MIYRHYHIQYTHNSKGENRWIIDNSDSIGEEGFATKDEAFAYVDALMEAAGKGDAGKGPLTYPQK